MGCDSTEVPGSVEAGSTSGGGLHPRRWAPPAQANLRWVITWEVVNVERERVGTIVKVIEFLIA